MLFDNFSDCPEVLQAMRSKVESSLDLSEVTGWSQCK